MKSREKYWQVLNELGIFTPVLNEQVTSDFQTSKDYHLTIMRNFANSIQSREKKSFKIDSIDWMEDTKHE